MWGVYKRKQDGTEVLLKKYSTMWQAHDHASALEEDWDDPSGATYTYKEIKAVTK